MKTFEQFINEKIKVKLSTSKEYYPTFTLGDTVLFKSPNEVPTDKDGYEYDDRYEMFHSEPLIVVSIDWNGTENGGTLANPADFLYKVSFVNQTKSIPLHKDDDKKYAIPGLFLKLKTP